MPTTIARTWERRLNEWEAGAPITRGKIRALHTTVLARSLDAIGGGRCNLTPDEAQHILDRVEQIRPRITDEQTEFGLNWLRTTGKKAGFDPSILDDFIEFRLVGVHSFGLDDSPSWGGPWSRGGAPIYAIVTRSGEWHYHCRPWTQGRGTDWSFRKVSEVVA